MWLLEEPFLAPIFILSAFDLFEMAWQVLSWYCILAERFSCEKCNQDLEFIDFCASAVIDGTARSHYFAQSLQFHITFWFHFINFRSCVIGCNLLHVCIFLSYLALIWVTVSNIFNEQNPIQITFSAEFIRNDDSILKL